MTFVLAVTSKEIGVGYLALGAFLVLVAIIVIGMFANYGSLYLKAALARCYISLPTIVSIRFRGISPHTIVDSYIVAKKAGLVISVPQLETHFLARGNVQNVVRAIIAADRAKLNLAWEQACAIDLAGRDILEAVRISVNPKVINVPFTGSQATIDAVALDGIQLKCKARVTVRANLARLVGGATEETIVARVGQGIITTIGSSKSYQDVLANPDSISRAVLEQGLGAGTAFEILSIDIADIDVGTNVGAVLNADRAEADMRVARAKAEERRAMAVAAEMENKALIEENRAKVVLAEAEVPQAISQAFRSGNLGLMDYYKMNNVQADTAMRTSISKSTEA